MDQICQSHDCDNVIRSTRSNQKFCSGACKTRQSRYRKQNGINSVPIGSRQQNNVVGSVVNSAMNTGFNNMLNDKPINNGVGMVAVKASAPHLTECITKRPLASALVALLGYYTAKSAFKSCSTRTTGSKKTIECKEASGVQKAGGAAAAVIGYNFILDNLDKIIENLPIVTDMKRNSNVTVTGRNVTNGVPVTFLAS